MTAFRLYGSRAGVMDDRLYAGDTIIGADSVTAGAISTVGAGTWTATAMVSGFIYRTGPTGAYTDTTDTAFNILNALAGNSPGADVAVGNTFKLRFAEASGQAMTLAYGAGVSAGSGLLSRNASASTVRDYIVTVLAIGGPYVLNCSTTNGSKTVTFYEPPGAVAWNIGPSVRAINITPGMTVTGTGIAAGTTVAGLTQGQGGLTGVTLSANATATTAAGAYVALTFGPTISIDSIGSGSL